MEDSSIQLFSNPQFGEIRAMRDEEGEPWFVAKDICNALGYTNNRKAIADHVEEEDKRDGVTIRDSIGRDQQATAINESGVYALVFGSKLEGAKAFKRWVTHDVLPAIRRTGGYMVAREDETPDQIMARAVLIAQDTIERQKRQIAEMRPKALFADAVAASDGTCLVGELAKMLTQGGYRVGQNRLFAELRERGYLGKANSNRNVPLQRYVEQGLFKIKETAITCPDGHVKVNRTTKVTGKGQAYFMHLFLDAVAE